MFALIVVGLEQEAGRTDTFALTSLLYQSGRSLVDCLAVAPPLLAVKKGGHWLLYSSP